MSPAVGNKIHVRVLLAANVVASVEILPRVRPPLARMFTGKEPSAVLNVMPRLFALCAAAQQTALVSAIETARDEVTALATQQHRIALIVIERIVDLARGLFVGHLTLNVASAAAIRSLMSELSAFGRSAQTARGYPQREVTGRIVAALATLGVWEGGGFRPSSPLALCAAALNEDGLMSNPTAHPFLSAADDPDITKRLLRDDPTFCYCPDLEGHVPETGPWARQMTRDPLSPKPFGAVERLTARIVEIIRLCAWLAAGARVDTAEHGIIGTYKLGPGRAAAAVECARGRLYHAVELDAQGRISRFEFLAPTEWNFHRRGPLVRNLKGAALTAQRRRDAVHAVIASLDPCVGFTLDFREFHDA
ncbi:hypothetical protein XH99_02000 [Bradyrhizobium nanningense]|uniref:Hydrogenase assembly protein HupF n=1 Tax=Bradyrhizobium nanningense TaxID=1325118 RepID=A0A4V1L3I1_9BRAD|nr:hypothetical protein [Bradyrhizobium nanningense]RXH38054.1 hypothetical protein XH99_02000 [Bradyrhizobium nanningense]